MGIVRTNQWLEEEFDRPTKICEKLLPYFKGYTATEIYHQLISFGMYKPSRSSKYIFDMMIIENMWDQVEKLFQHYQKKWSGPDIPIFLFPIAQSGGFFFRMEKNKSGVSYPDKMFLFLSPLDDSKELEALFVHEYHHVCRLSKLNKKMNQYTLLDSIIIEGLAEYAVLKNCGRNYTASWCHMYTEQEIKGFWKKYLNDQLDRKKNERAHDQLLYGGGRIPKLLGYAAGYQIVKEYYESHHYSTKQSFTIASSKFIE